MIYKSLIKPVLFCLSPESAHKFVFFSLKAAMKIPGIKFLIQPNFKVQDTSLEKTVFGIHFPNPVGLAAGFDKDAKLFEELSVFGFGFIEVGTVTPKPQLGNPKPRLFRLIKDN